MIIQRSACAVLMLAIFGFPLVWGQSDGPSVTFRQDRDANFKDAMAFKNLLRSLKPGEKRDDLGPRFAKLKEPGKWFGMLVEECRRNNDKRD